MSKCERSLPQARASIQPVKTRVLGSKLRFRPGLVLVAFCSFDPRFQFLWRDHFQKLFVSFCRTQLQFPAPKSSKASTFVRFDAFSTLIRLAISSPFQNLQLQRLPQPRHAEFSPQQSPIFASALLPYSWLDAVETFCQEKKIGVF